MVSIFVLWELLRKPEVSGGFRVSAAFLNLQSHTCRLPCVLSGLCWKTSRRGSFISDWSGCLHCPRQRRWMRYGSCGPSKEFSSRRQNTFSPKTKLSLTILVFLLPPSQALTSIRAVRGQANDGLSSALLVVFLDSARNLPVSLVQFPSMHLHRHFYTRVVKLKEY